MLGLDHLGAIDALVEESVATHQWQVRVWVKVVLTILAKFVIECFHLIFGCKIVLLLKEVRNSIASSVKQSHKLIVLTNVAVLVAVVDLPLA